MPPKRKNTEVSYENADTKDWSSLTVASLKNELALHGLPISGNKTTLIERLEAHDANAEDEQDADDEMNDDAGGTAQETDWSALTIRQLKAELSSRGLPISGNKTTLLSRLESPDDAPHQAKKAKITHQVAIPAGPRNDGNGELRLRPFVEGPDADYNKKLKKIQKERLFMLDRKKGVDKDGFVCEIFDIAGSTGNVYQTTIGRSPKCVCMDARMRGQKCKHINYALINILKAPANLCYQLAFLSSELNNIFANAPVTRAPDAAHDHNHEHSDDMYTGKRKPIEGECPICVFDMEPGEEIVWCKAACGQNFHKECFDQWKRSKNGGVVTCVYCRTPWQEDIPDQSAPGGLAALKNMAPKIGSYKNVAHLMPQYQQEK